MTHRLYVTDDYRTALHKIWFVKSAIANVPRVKRWIIKTQWFQKKVFFYIIYNFLKLQKFPDFTKCSYIGNLTTILNPEKYKLHHHFTTHSWNMSRKSRRLHTMKVHNITRKSIYVRPTSLNSKLYTVCDISPRHNLQMTNKLEKKNIEQDWVCGT